MKSGYLTFILILLTQFLVAQEQTEKKIDVKFSGFIKSDVFYDSRQNVEALEGLLLILPKDIELDENGNDINDQSTLGIVDISTRVRGNITGPDVLGAKLTGLVEVDWTGIAGNSATSRVRLRHAYSKLNWDKTELLIGREWHPMFVKDCYPSVMSLNTGIPFQPFNRSPMIQVAHELGKFKIIGAAISQSDYVSSGIDYKSIMPRISTESLINEDSVFITDEKVNSLAYMGYFKYKKSKLEIKAKAIYGQNLSESVMPGGYGVSVLDSITGHEQYTPFNHLYTWGNIIYGNQTKFALFAGYTKNMGAVDPIVGDTYGMALNLDYVYRIAPSVSHKIKNFMMAVELEYTVAAYGDLQNKYGEYTTSHVVSNTRVMFSLFHFF